MKKEPTAPNGGQWGVSQDDWGKLWFVDGGGEKGPVNYQTGIVYGAFNTKDQVIPEFNSVWPIVGLADVQGGEYRYRPEDGTLNHFTAACGGEIYRGDRLPAEIRGDLFFGEPVGRLVRRAKVEVKDGITLLSNPYGHSEFIRSADPLFRAVNFNTAPDGTLYITDMYRGIIQEGNWVKDGTYLRKAVQQCGLDKEIGRGRIYRLVYDGLRPGPQPGAGGKRNAGPTRPASRASERLVARYRAKASRPQAGQIRGARADPPWPGRARTRQARLHALWTLRAWRPPPRIWCARSSRDEDPPPCAPRPCAVSEDALQEMATLPFPGDVAKCDQRPEWRCRPPGPAHDEAAQYRRLKKSPRSWSTRAPTAPPSRKSAA